LPKTQPTLEKGRDYKKKNSTFDFTVQLIHSSMKDYAVILTSALFVAYLSTNPSSITYNTFKPKKTFATIACQGLLVRMPFCFRTALSLRQKLMFSFAY
jgi:hypothetical protein